MISSEGQIKYVDNNFVYLQIDQAIQDYYYSLIPKYKTRQRQKHPAHLTVVRQFEKPPFMQYWEKYSEWVIPFIYDPKIQVDDKYYFLEAFSAEAGMLRQELGLPYYREGKWCFHISIGNLKQEK